MLTDMTSFLSCLHGSEPDDARVLDPFMVSKLPARQ